MKWLNNIEEDELRSAYLGGFKELVDHVSKLLVKRGCNPPMTRFKIESIDDNGCLEYSSDIGARVGLHDLLITSDNKLAFVESGGELHGKLFVNITPADDNTKINDFKKGYTFIKTPF